MVLAQAAILFWFWNSGQAAAWRDRLRGAVRSTTALRFCFGASLALVARAGALLPAFYLYRVDRAMGISTQLTGAWGADWLASALLSAVIAGVIATVVLALVDRTHYWYLYAIACVVAIGLGSAYLAPFVAPVPFDRYVPLDAKHARALAPIAARAGHPGIPIVIEQRSLRTGIELAAVEGLGGSTRIVLSDTLVEAQTEGELAFTVARQLGRLNANDPLHLALWQALIVILGAALAVLAADRIRFRGDDDPLARLVLVGALLSCVYLIAEPIDLALQRHGSAAADGYALRLTGDRASAVRALVRSADQRMEEACPDIVARMLHDRLPPLGERVAAINGVPNGCP